MPQGSKALFVVHLLTDATKWLPFRKCFLKNINKLFCKSQSRRNIVFLKKIFKVSIPPESFQKGKNPLKNSAPTPIVFGNTKILNMSPSIKNVLTSSS